MQAINNLRKPCQMGKLFLWQTKADKMAKNKTVIAIFAASKKHLIYERNMDSTPHPHPINV